MDGDVRFPKKAGLLYKNRRLLNFFENDKFVDCTFRIETNEVKAHKLILACSSPVFEKMFFGSMASDDIIILTDINLAEFNQMLQFIYTEEVDISSVVNAWSLFYIANKYLLDDLVSICLEYITKNMTMSSLVLSYEYSEMYDIKELKKMCYIDIINCISVVFTSDYHMKPSTLRSILLNTMLQVNNFVLATAVLEWGVNECTYRQLQVTSVNIIHILKSENILELMCKDWFHSRCDRCFETLLTCECVSDVIHKTLVCLVDEVHWCKVQGNSVQERLKIIPDNCKYRRSFKIARRIDLNESDEFVTHMSVNRKTFILGFLLNTEMNLAGCFMVYEGSIRVSICEQQEKSVDQCCEPTTVKQLFYYNSEHYVRLKGVVILEPEKIYDIRISYKNYNNGLISSVICNYMSNNLFDETKECDVTFYDPVGTVIRGAAFYPA